MSTIGQPAQTPAFKFVQSLGMSQRERAQYSVARAVAAAQGNAPCFEREVSQELTRGRRASGIVIPFEVLGSGEHGRATSIAGSGGTAQHLVPQQQHQFLSHLFSQLAFLRAGVTTLPGLVGDVDFPSGDSLGTAGTPGENASQADSEATFRNVRASAKPVRTRATFTRTLLNNSDPSVDRIISNILTQRIAIKLESQMMVGTGSGGQLLGIDNVVGVNNLDFASGAVNYPNFLNCVTVTDNAKGLVGPMSFVTSMGVIAKGLTTYRNSGEASIAVLSNLPGQPDVWSFDGLPVYRAHEVKRTYAVDGSPSDLTAHGLYAGVFSETFLCLFGPGVEVIVDPFTAAATDAITMWARVDADYVVPRPEVIGFANNIDIA